MQGCYVVSAGDTLRGLALAVFGDAQLQRRNCAGINAIHADGNLRRSTAA